MRTTVGIGIVLAGALGAIVFASAAGAAPPIKTSFQGATGSSTLSGVCSFDVHVDSVLTGFEIDFFDGAGNQVKAQIHQVEQDTFSANGKTLTGLPFTFNLDIPLDSDGNPTAAISTGIVEKVPLPDGSLFVSAGYVNFLDHPGASFLLSPDRGNNGNVAAFCAALSP
jgi:hypothetical protein